MFSTRTKIAGAVAGGIIILGAILFNQYQIAKQLVIVSREQPKIVVITPVVATPSATIEPTLKITKVIKK